MSIRTTKKIAGVFLKPDYLTIISKFIGFFLWKNSCPKVLCFWRNVGGFVVNLLLLILWTMGHSGEFWSFISLNSNTILIIGSPNFGKVLQPKLWLRISIFWPLSLAIKWQKFRKIALDTFWRSPILSWILFTLMLP